MSKKKEAEVTSEEIVEEVKNEEKKKRKVLVIVFGILLAVAILVAIIFLVMYLLKPKYEVKLNTNGGTITKEIVVEKNVITELPEIKAPENKELVCWVTENNEAVRVGIELFDDISLTPIWRDKDEETVTLKYDTKTDEKIPEVKMPKGSKVILPVKPSHDTWKFLYWIDKDGYIVLKDKVIEEDTTIYAYWFKPDVEKVTIEFETDTDEKIDSIIINKGSTIIFPTPSKLKEGFVFRGWLDEDNNLIEANTKIEKDMKLKANWKEPYTCPEDCTPNEGGATCNRESIVAPSSKTECPSGSFEYYGKCITRTGGESAKIRQCNEWDWGDEVMYGDWCMKKVNKVTVYTCPEGYSRDGDNCKKIETIECTAN